MLITLQYAAVIFLLFCSSIFLVLSLRVAIADDSTYRKNKDATVSISNALSGQLPATKDRRRDSDSHCGIAVDTKKNDLIFLSCLSSENVENLLG